MMEISTPVTRFLDERHIPYRLFQHSGPVHNLEEVARQRGERPEQIVRSILFRLSSDDFLMVLIAGPGQISWKALRVYLDQSRLTTATEEEVNPCDRISDWGSFPVWAAPAGAHPG